VKTNIASTIGFLGFLALGLLVAFSGQFFPEGGKRKVKNMFLGFALFISLAAGVTQHNMWPFSSWPVLAMQLPAATRDLPTPRIVAVDSDGIERDIDYRAWQPLSLEELNSWMNLHFFKLDAAAKDRVGKYLLDRANHAREQALSPSGLAYPNRWLGPFTAPTHLLHPAIWSHADNVPKASFVKIRIYEQSWDLELRERDPSRVTRALAYEYPRP
jgi:hypothetical protein